MHVPDVVGNSLERATTLLQEAGVTISNVSSIEPPSDWKPRDAHDFKTEQYVVMQRMKEQGRAVELVTVPAWLPPDN